jgi:TrmH family RNA methyltransferase
MSNPLRPLKWYKELADTKGRRQAGAFLVEGDRAIRQIIGQQPGAVREILSIGEPPPPYRDYPVRLLRESQFNSVSGTRTPQGIMAVVAAPEDIYTDKLPQDSGEKILLLEDIQDPGNAGTLIRTAAALDFSGVILSDKCADPLAPKTVQATAGTVLSVWLRRTENYLGLAAGLQAEGYDIVAADLAGDAGPADLARQDRLVLALGNEAAGLSAALLETADRRLRIPIARKKAESLNVATSGAILMYLATYH